MLLRINDAGSLVPAAPVDVLENLGSSFVEDFDAGPSVSGSVATSSQPWNLSNASGGSMAGTPTNGSVANPGVWTLNTGSTSSSGRSGILRGFSTNQGYLFFGGLYRIFCEWVIQIPTLSAGLDTFDALSGLGDQAGGSGVGTNCILWRATTAGTWACQIVSGGVVSPLSMASVAPVATGWIRQTIESDGTNLRFKMGLGRSGALTTFHTVSIAALPAGISSNPIGQIAKIQKVTGANNRELRLDLCRFALG